MRKAAIFRAWGHVLLGYRPFLSIEITRECQLKCAGCHAFAPGHLNNVEHPGHDEAEFRGEELVQRVLDLVRSCRPLHVSFVGGEPLIRSRELAALIERLNALRIETQIITSAVRPIPKEWNRFENLHLVVSVDGLPPEHNARRSPATYDRILRHIDGHHVIVHCTITPQLLIEPDYLARFARTWSSQPNARKIWFSLYTPQVGERSRERLSFSERRLAIERIAALRGDFPKVNAPAPVIRGYGNPPQSPSECIFAQTTTCVSADLSSPVVPCQIGGRPECSECGCMAAAGFAAIGGLRLAGLVRISDIFALSKKFGDRWRSWRQCESATR